MIEIPFSRPSKLAKERIKPSTSFTMGLCTRSGLGSRSCGEEGKCTACEISLAEKTCSQKLAHEKLAHENLLMENLLIEKLAHGKLAREKLAHGKLSAGTGIVQPFAPI
jgi:hypothetical protein